jgi:hypothetical protein
MKRSFIEMLSYTVSRIVRIRKENGRVVNVYAILRLRIVWKKR